MNRLRIVRRSYGNYEDFCGFTGNHLAAVEVAADFERQNRDGEYLVRGLDEPNWTPRSSYQSGFDWI